MATWTPASLGNLSHTQVRNVEKTVRIFYLHFVRNQLAGPESSSLQKALETQQRRMEEAAKAYQAEREAEARRKRERIDEELEAPKKVKLEHPQQPGASPSSAAHDGDRAAGEAFRNASVRTTGGVERNPLAAFDVKTLPITLVIDLIIANLEALSEQDLHAAITNMRANLRQTRRPLRNRRRATTRTGPCPGTATATPTDDYRPGPPQRRCSHPLVKLEQDQEDTVQDPLQMDMAEEDLDLLEVSGRDRARAASANGQDDDEEELSMAVIENFALAPPEYLSLGESDALIKDTVAKICELGSSSSALAASSPSSTGAHALWSSLVIRLATRGFAEPPGASDEASAGTAPETKVVGGVAPTRTLATQADIVRALMLEFVKATWRAARALRSTGWRKSGSATACVASKPVRKPTVKDQYPIWLEKLVHAWIPTIDAKDRSLAKFLADLPEIAPAVLDLVAELSKDKVKMIAGMSTLQDICMSRPALRDQAADKLLQLTRTSERTTRARRSLRSSSAPPPTARLRRLSSRLLAATSTSSSTRRSRPKRRRKPRPRRTRRTVTSWYRAGQRKR